MLAACQKENEVPEAGSTLKLFAEGFKGDASKMTVDHGQAYWTNNDSVRVNNRWYPVLISSTNSGCLYTAGNALTYPLRAISPARLSRGVNITGDQVQITLPAVYQYDQVVYDANTSRQVLDAPMAAYATEGDELHFKHLTGALAVKITNNTGAQISLERIKVTSSGAKLSGTFNVDFTDLTSPIGPVRATTDEEYTVTMRFDKTEKVIGNGRTVYIQIPVPPVGSSNRFRIVVEYRHKGAAYVGRRCCYTFNKRQSTAGALGRAELGYVPVTAPTHGEDEGMYFFLDDDNYNIIQNIHDLRTFATINLASEIGSNHKYRITQDIDASGYTLDPIVLNAAIGTFELDGGDHTIRNITFNSSGNFCGMFKDLAGSTTGHDGHKYIHNLNLSNTTLNISANTAYAGPLAARTGTTNTNGSTTTIRDCMVYATTYNLQATNTQPKRFGGLIGQHQCGGLVIDNCYVRRASFLYNGYSLTGRLHFGGLVGYNNVTFADQSTPGHEFRSCSVQFSDDNPCTLQSSTAYFGGILGYSNTNTLRSSKMYFYDLSLTVPASSLHVISTLNDVYVGALIGQTSSSCASDAIFSPNFYYINARVNALCPENKTYYTGGKYYWLDASYNLESYGTDGANDRKRGTIGNADANGNWFETYAQHEQLKNWRVYKNDGNRIMN